MPTGRVIAFTAVLSTSIAAPHAAMAQANYHASPLGGRSALLGGTGVALGEDGAAPFLNPATIVQIEDRRIAFSARFFRFAVRSVDDFSQPGPVDPVFGPLDLRSTSATSLSLHTVPDTTCYFFKRTEGEPGDLSGKSKLAICYAKTEEQEFGIDSLGFAGQTGGRRVDQSTSFEETWGRHSVGPTFAIYVTDEIALGASAHLVRTKHDLRSSVSNVVETLETGASSAAAYHAESSGHSWDGVLQIGATLRPFERWTFGASVTVPRLHFGGGYSFSEDSRFSGTEASGVHRAGNGDFEAAFPLRLNLGAGWELPDVRLEADLFVNSGVSDFVRADFDEVRIETLAGQVSSRTETRSTLSESVNAVVNVGLGAEYFLSENLSVLAGVTSDVSALPELEPTASRQRLFRTRFDAWHAGLGLSARTDQGEIVFGTRWDYLRGDILAINGFSTPPENARVSASEWAGMLVIAGRVTLSNVQKAAETVTETVRGEAPAATEYEAQEARPRPNPP